MNSNLENLTYISEEKYSEVDKDTRKLKSQLTKDISSK